MGADRQLTCPSLSADAANTTKLLAANGTDSIDMSHVRFARVDYGTETVISELHCGQESRDGPFKLTSVPFFPPATKWLIFKWVSSDTHTHTHMPPID